MRWCVSSRMTSERRPFGVVALRSGKDIHRPGHAVSFEEAEAVFIDAALRDFTEACEFCLAEHTPAGESTCDCCRYCGDKNCGNCALEAADERAGDEAYDLSC